MIVNTTYLVEASTEESFLDYLASFYIPKAVVTGLMTNERLCRVLADNPDGGISYALQFSVDSDEQYERWSRERGERLNRMLATKFSNRVVGFVTRMEEVAL